MQATKAEIQAILRALQEMPKQFAAVAARAEESMFSIKPGKGEWSTVETLAHLRSCADVWGASIEAMLRDDEPTLADTHPRQWIKNTNYARLTFSESFSAYQRQRGKLVRVLEGLSFEAWSRGAQIGGRRHTVFSQARRLARHEAEHSSQVRNLADSI